MRKTSMYVKVVSLLVALVLALGCLASCEEPTVAGLIEDAAAKMSEQPFTATASMTFSSDNETYNQIFSAMSIEDMKILVSGNDVAYSMEMEAMGAKTAIEYTVVSGVIYAKSTVSAFGQTETEKQKATVSEADANKILADMNVSIDVNPEDFVESKLEEDGDTYVITCSGKTDKLNESLMKTLGGLAESFEGSFAISAVNYVVRIKDDLVEKETLSATFNISVQGQEISFTLNMNMAYDYESPVSITAPQDAASYEEVDYGDIIG